MNRTLTSSNWNTFVIALLISLGQGFLWESKAQITRVELMKTKGKTEDYLAIEKEWKNIHQRRLDKGLIYGWYLVGKHFTGTTDPYDYITVTIYPSFEAMQNPFPDEILEGYDDEFLQNTEASRDLIRTEIYDTPLITELVKLPRFLHISFMKVDQGMDEDYLTLEQDIWKPVHEALIKEGIQTSWSVYRQLYPAGNNAEYNYVTINGFSDIRKVSQEPPQGWEEILKTIHAGKNVNQIFSSTYDLRKQVRMELWEILEIVIPQ